MTLSMWIFMFMPPPQLQTHYDTKHVDIYVYAPPQLQTHYDTKHVDIYVYVPPPPITDTFMFMTTH